MYIQERRGFAVVKSEDTLSSLLNDYMKENNLKIYTISEHLEIPRKKLSEFLNGTNDLDIIDAIKIMHLLNISEEDFVVLCAKKESSQEIEEIDKAKKLSFIFENFDVAALKSIGIIKPRLKFNQIEDRLCKYFGLSSIYEYNNPLLFSTLFSKSKIRVAEEKERKMITFWLKSMIYSFKCYDNPNPFDLNLLHEFLKRIKTFTKDPEKGFHTVVLVLYSLGISVITQSYLKNTRAFGCTMILDDKPCIIITDQGKTYHKLWLTLLHELYHIINDWDYLENKKIHITDNENPDLFVDEVAADQFARDILVSPSSMQLIKKNITYPFKMNEISKKIEIEISIAYGVYLESLNRESQHEEYPLYSKYLKDSSVAISNIKLDYINCDSIKSAIEKMKEELLNKRTA
ncbi:MAG: hypothetical protein RR303_07580 [Bacteroidales bacterium]